MSSVISALLGGVYIPKMARVRQRFPRPQIKPEAIPETIFQLLEEDKFSEKIQPGMSVCITAGSRGIANIALITRTLVEYCIKRGAKPFIVPAMGSHGGALAEGQREILAALGITEETMGCPIRATMETVKVGETEEGHSVRIDKYAAAADAIIVSCRIKPHTGFRGPYESGIMKMLAIGLGKQYGASICHKRGWDLMPINVPSFGRTALKYANIPFAIGIVENAFHQTHTIRAIPNECVETEEPELLLLAKSLMASIPFEKVDVLMLEQIGKEISGDGMDPNVVGRAYNYKDKPFIHRIGVLHLSPKTGSNFNGIGNADVTTRKVLEAGSFEETYPNAITSIITEYLRIPAVMDNDKLCLQMCLRTCPDLGVPLKVFWTKDTLHMGEFYVSESMLADVEANPNLSTDGKLYELAFDQDDNYTGFRAVEA